MGIGDSVKGVLTNAEKAGITGLRAIVLNHPTASVLISLAVGFALGAWLL